MAEYKSPGVYIEEQSTLGNSVVGVRTAVPAFIGYTEKATDTVDNDLHEIPKRITSMRDYERYFGGPWSPSVTVSLSVGTEPKKPSYLASDIVVDLRFQTYYALSLYFDNGGSEAWVVSVDKYPSDRSLLPSETALGKGLDLLERVPEITLVYFPDQPSVVSTARYNVLGRALEQCERRKDRFLIMDVNVGEESAFKTGIGDDHRSFGAAYYPDLKTSLKQEIKDALVTFKRKVSSNGTDMLTPFVANGVTLASLPNDTDGDWMKNLRTVLVGLGYACVHPGGAALGVIASTDRERGVWQAPANRSLRSVVSPVKNITDAEQSALNVPSDGKSINAIRQFQGLGTLVWGARTLDTLSKDWRYIQVRRTVIYIEQSLKNALQLMVFEPNDANTWAKVRTMTESFLSDTWRQGGLAGAHPSDAFTVQCGLGPSMTTEDILNGRLILNVAVAITRPAEFIIISLSQTLSS